MELTQGVPRTDFEAIELRYFAILGDAAAKLARLCQIGETEQVKDVLAVIERCRPQLLRERAGARGTTYLLLLHRLTREVQAAERNPVRPSLIAGAQGLKMKEME